MRCKQCGALNEDYLEYCEQCAAPLTPVSAADTTAPEERGYRSYAASTGETPPAWGFVKAPQWPKPNFDANTVTEEDIPENYFARFNPRPADAARQTPAPAAPAEPYPDEVRAHTPPPREVPRKTAAPARGYDPYRGTQAPPEDAQAPRAGERTKPRKASDDYEDYQASYSRPRSRKAGGRPGVLFAAAAGGLILLIALFGFILVQARHGGSFSKFVSCTFKGDPILRAPKVEATTTNAGDPGYLITIYTKRNCSFRFTAGASVQEKDIQSNSVRLSIPEKIWIPDEPLDTATLSIKPDLVIIDAKGRETPVEFEEPITIGVPAIGLTVTQPTVPDLTVESLSVPIAGTVDDSTASIFVGENQLSVDEAGNFSTTYTLPGAGTYALEVRAQKNGCMSAVQTYNITYGEPTDPTTPATGNVIIGVNDSVVRYGTGATMPVSGTMEPGATISVSGVELEGAITQDAAAGTFSFTVKTPDAKLYEVAITATKGEAAKTTTLLLEHQPDLDTYSRGAYALNYEALQTSPHHNQAYKVVGTITEVRQRSPYIIARIQTTKGDIMFCYISGKATIEVGDGKTYELYADPYGTDAETGLPYMHAWFILKKAG